jgi:hypothetical protein
VEKYWIARQATSIVVAQLHGVWSFPWFDGWHVRGKLTVSRVVRGRAYPGENLNLRFVCSCCPRWPWPDMEPLSRNQGIWFLVPSKQGDWTSAGECSDPGYRRLSDLESFQKFVDSGLP